MNEQVKFFEIASAITQFIEKAESKAEKIIKNPPPKQN